MPEKISIVKESGETISSNIVSIFLIPDTGKKYIITTENAVDPHGLTVLHVSEIVDGNLQKIATDDEWSSIKTIMRAIISGNVVSYQYLPPIETANASSQYSRDISVSASASKQMVDNYNAADKTTEDTPVEGAEETPSEEQAVDASQTPPSSIFPVGESEPSGDEVIPGISEVPIMGPEENTVPVDNPNMAIDPNVQPVPVNSPEVEQPAPIAPVDMNVNGVVAPVMDMTGQGMMAPIPEANMPIDPVMGLQNPMPPVDNGMFNPQVNDINQFNNMNMGMTNEVQVVDPSQMIPAGQIVQNVGMNGMNPPMGSMMMPNVSNPSFNPNATLDEVVVAAQDMFMVGVKNLIDTVTEKVYRDLYAKEAELKAREEAILQKEQMFAVNPGMMSFNSGMMSMNQGMVPNNIMQTAGVPPIQQMNVMPQPNQFSQQNMMMNPGMNNMNMNPGMNTGMQPIQSINNTQQMPVMPQGVPAPVLPQAPIPISVPNDVA